MASKFGNLFYALFLAGFLVLCQVTDCSRTMSVSKQSGIKTIYQSTVSVNYHTSGDSFRGTGWVCGNDKKLNVSYIMTAAHVVEHEAPGIIDVSYWPGKGDWEIVPAVVILKKLGRVAGDVAILVVPVLLEPLPIAAVDDYKIDDEILIAGVQQQAPPALVSIGHIVKINNTIDKIVVNGWSWRGHSGGPLIHKKSGKVIGFVTMFATDDIENASATECSNLNIITDAISQVGLR